MRHLHAALVELRCHRTERRGVGNFPAELDYALAAIGLDHYPLFAVIHEEGERGA